MLMHMCGARPEYYPFVVFYSACPYSTATQARYVIIKAIAVNSF